ncbi:flagellar biosynthesis protein FlhB [Halobacteriovorax sp. JY17]|uniref:flagellar biosynthesis protein FlhB n=1 Tax=Halobacteriovorax sp. JY17 TaxID=2014617 RepID=UPI000C437CCE|nr:flagellar biosynthesis protein FlhB [Halobacteriovorax sp. JY17]PIK14909.1 MAG: flagellar biosynthesis protein FlhB [Halobacteriovorax sp. JY17]
MADENDSDAEKTEDPSAHRIEEFRKRGEVASSKELTSVLVLAASLMTLGLSMVYMYEVLSEFIEWLYRLDVASAYTEKSMNTIVHKLITVSLKSVAPIFLVTLAIGVTANVAQVGLLFSPEVLEWKPDRINPLQGVKKLFSMKSLVEAIKGVLKFIFVLGIVYYFLKDEMHTFGGFFHLDFFQSFLYGKGFLIKLGFAIVLGLVVIAIGDFAYQKFSYKKKLMMTKEEAKQEHKQQDGNPEIKQRIRAVQREMSQRRVMSEVPKADVIVTNPTHISIALKYDPETMVSPEVIAKGADVLALKIREIAKGHDIPIVENVPLARGLYKTVKEGQGVPRNLYKAVAEVLAFTYKLKRQKKALS